MPKTEKSKRYEQINVPRDVGILEKIDRLCRKLEREKGVPVERWVATNIAIDEALESRKGER